MDGIVLIGKNEYEKLTGKLDHLQTLITEKPKKLDVEYLTTGDFQRKFGISKVTQWKLRKAGKLPYRAIGKSILYRLSEIDEITKQ
jgi:hypothetical protein